MISDAFMLNSNVSNEKSWLSLLLYFGTDIWLTKKTRFLFC